MNESASPRCIWAGSQRVTINYPSHLLDALARVHAEAALDRLIKDEIAMQAELEARPKQDGVAPSADTEKEVTLDGPENGESSDNRQQSLPPEPNP